MVRPVVRNFAMWACTAMMTVAQARSYEHTAEQKQAERNGFAKAGGEMKAAVDLHGWEEDGDGSRGEQDLPESLEAGERAVGLMWRDDLDTAFRHLDPGPVRVPGRASDLVSASSPGNIDPKSPNL